MSDIRDRDDVQQFVERTEGRVYPRRVFMSMATLWASRRSPQG